jgi:hypothetical protein
MGGSCELRWDTGSEGNMMGVRTLFSRARISRIWELVSLLELGTRKELQS